METETESVDDAEVCILIDVQVHTHYMSWFYVLDHLVTLLVKSVFLKNLSWVVLPALQNLSIPQF